MQENKQKIYKILVAYIEIYSNHDPWGVDGPQWGFGLNFDIGRTFLIVPDAILLELSCDIVSHHIHTSTKSA